MEVGSGDDPFRAQRENQPASTRPRQVVTVLTFIATIFVILGTWVVVMRAVDDGAWVTVFAAIVVCGALLTGLYFLAARRDGKRRS